MEVLNQLLSSMGSTDWKKRLDTLLELTTFCERSPQSASYKLVKLFDGLNPRINDSNSKVQLAALQSVNKMIPLFQVTRC